MNEVSKETLALLAYIYLEYFKYDKALTLLKALNIFYPDDLDIMRSLAYAYLKNDDFQSALMYAEGCLKKETTEKSITAAKIIKSKALWGLGKEEAARFTFAQALSQEPSYPSYPSTPKITPL